MEEPAPATDAAGNVDNQHADAEFQAASADPRTALADPEMGLPR
jgi:hypothetical protein